MTLHTPDHPALTIEALVDWLRTQPPEKTYIWSDPVFCAVGQYLADHDSSWGTVAYSELPDYERIAKVEPHTFGAALERAEKLLALPAPESKPLVPKALPLPELELVAVAEDVPAPG